MIPVVKLRIEQYLNMDNLKVTDLKLGLYQPYKGNFYQVIGLRPLHRHGEVPLFLPRDFFLYVLLLHFEQGFFLHFEHLLFVGD